MNLFQISFHRASKRSRRRAGKRSLRSTSFLILAVLLIIIAVASSALFFLGQKNSPGTNTTTSQSSGKLVILYVNQGNGLVNESKFPSLVSLAKSQGFNTIFFQVYRSGNLVFSSDEMKYFVAAAHQDNLRIFFALYFTNSSQVIPGSIYGLGEDGISLDMSTLNFSSQNALLSTLKQDYHGGLTAVTTTNFTTTLNPDILILETYSLFYRNYIHPGIVAGVEVLATSSKADYESQVQYALNNSDGVMVFDYYGLIVTGY